MEGRVTNSTDSRPFRRALAATEPDDGTRHEKALIITSSSTNIRWAPAAERRDSAPAQTSRERLASTDVVENWRGTECAGAV